MWIWIACTTAGVMLASRLIYRFISGKCVSSNKLVGKTVIVTGASAGIGKETAKDLAERGARVILACRNVEKAQKVADDIINSTGNGQVVVRELELSSLASVRRFAKKILETENALHILINNAGKAGCSRRVISEDGLEMTMATNHYGHFLLTNLLLGLMKKSGSSRVINVSSIAHELSKSLDLDNLRYEKEPFPYSFSIYGDSKLANILFTRELAEKLRDTDITVNALHPGAVNTEIVSKMDNSIIRYIGIALFWIFAKDEKLGAQTTIYLAVADEVANISGEYFSDCRVRETTDLAKDAGFAKKFWEASEQLVSLAPEERHF